jgi:hypothetical protein
MLRFFIYSVPTVCDYRFRNELGDKKVSQLMAVKFYLGTSGVRSDWAGRPT